MTKVSDRYFTILEDYFGDLRNYVSKKGYTGPVLSVEAVMELYSPRIHDSILSSLYEDISKLDWDSQTNELDGLGGVRSSYLGGAYMYLNNTNKTFDFLKKTALYSDTTIVNDPILSELTGFQIRGTGEGLSFQLVAQYALQLLANKELFNSDSHPPICFLAPSSVLTLQKRNTYDTTYKLIQNHIVPFYSSLLFNKTFSSEEDVLNYLEKFKDFKEFLSAVQKSNTPIIDPDGLPLNEEKCVSIKEYYETKYCEEYSLSGILFAIIRGRFSMASYDLAVNSAYTSNFATDFRSVWDSMLLLMKNDSLQMTLTNRHLSLPKDSMVLNVLHDKSLSWLGNVPLNKIKMMRDNGELQEMRDILGENIEEIQTTKEEDFVEVGRQVKHNLDEAFKRHSRDIKELNNTFKKKYRIDTASLVVSGALGLASSLYPPLTYIAGVTGGSTVVDIVKNYFQQRTERKALQRKPIAILFEAYNESSD